jgi:ribosomal protein S27E
MSAGPVGQRTIAIHCARCGVLLFRYHKGGTGGLVKCFLERIAEDRTKGDMTCPQCGQEFARPRTIGGRAAAKIIGGKVYTRGMRRK